MLDFINIKMLYVSILKHKKPFALWATCGDKDYVWDRPSEIEIWAVDRTLYGGKYV